MNCSCKAVFILSCCGMKECAGPHGVCPLLLPSPGWHMVQIRLAWSFQMCLRSFWLTIPSKDILVGTAPLDCVEIPCVEGKSCLVPMLVFIAPSLFCVLEGSCSSLSFPARPAPHREGFSLFGELWRARGSLMLWEH